MKMKNPEHESGYFEDGSDVEMVYEENTTGDGRKSGTGSYGLSEAIRQLDVTDSPASPEPVVQKNHDGASTLSTDHTPKNVKVPQLSNENTKKKLGSPRFFSLKHSHSPPLTIFPK